MIRAAAGPQFRVRAALHQVAVAEHEDPVGLLHEAQFVRHQQGHPDRFWILAGGLNPDNIGDAIQATGTKFVDVNSGIEAAPGIKDHEKLKRFVVRLHEAAEKR